MRWIKKEAEKRADSYKLNEQSNYDEIRTRISSFIHTHTQHTHKGLVIKIIEMNDSNGVDSIWMAWRTPATVQNPC